MRYLFFIAADAAVRFAVSHEDPKHSKIILEVESLPDDDGSAGKFNNTHDTVFTGVLECLRLCVPEKLKDAPVVLVTKSKDRVWLKQIIQKYNKHKKGLPLQVAPGGMTTMAATART